jgi:hypothetical protein
LLRDGGLGVAEAVGAEDDEEEREEGEEEFDEVKKPTSSDAVTK